MYKLLAVAVAIGAAVGGFWWLNGSLYEEKRGEPQAAGKALGVDAYKSLTYRVQGEPVTLQNGFAESEAAPGSASRVVTRYFGNEAWGDLDGDGTDDVAFLLTQESGGSGTFYYAAAALQKGDGYLSVDATIVGDRIAPQTTEIRDGILIVNYADRAPGEPMSAQPSAGKSLHLKLDPQLLQFGEVVQDFEGESADGSR